MFRGIIKVFDRIIYRRVLPELVRIQIVFQTLGLFFPPFIKAFLNGTACSEKVNSGNYRKSIKLKAFVDSFTKKFSLIKK